MKFLTAVLLIIPFVACSEDDVATTAPPEEPQAARVLATPQITFTPAQLQVELNRGVTWVFQSVPHNVFFADAPGRPQDIPGFNTGTSISRTFDTEGTFDYECRIHPGMRGTVIVSAANSGS